MPQLYRQPRAPPCLGCQCWALCRPPSALRRYRGCGLCSEKAGVGSGLFAAPVQGAELRLLRSREGPRQVGEPVSSALWVQGRGAPVLGAVMLCARGLAATGRRHVLHACAGAKPVHVGDAPHVPGSRGSHLSEKGWQDSCCTVRIQLCTRAPAEAVEEPGQEHFRPPGL